jgi:GntR family transcriptional regulator
MLPFSVRFKAGEPVYTQVVYAAVRAMVSGQLRMGDVFPSVRALSQELRINPNTAQKVIGALKEKGLLEVQPGVGTLVAKLPELDRRQRMQLLREQAEELVVEAMRLRLESDEVVEAVREHWARLSREKA